MGGKWWEMELSERCNPGGHPNTHPPATGSAVGLTTAPKSFVAIGGTPKSALRGAAGATEAREGSAPFLMTKRSFHDFFPLISRAPLRLRGSRMEGFPCWRESTRKGRIN